MNWRAGTEITLLHVYDVAELSSIASAIHEEDLRQEEQNARQALERAATLFADPDLKVSTSFQLSGPAHAVIMETAEKLDADIILVADRGQSAIRRFFLGNVTYRIVNAAHCSVLVVRS